MAQSSSMSAKRKQAKVQILIKRDGDRCWFCWRGFTEERKRTLDHMIPVSADGTNAIENLVLSCEECNQIKGNRVRDYRPGCFRNLYRGTLEEQSGVAQSAERLVLDQEV